jgi:hypothetical protein
MSCNRCANQAQAAMQAAGVPARQTQAAWAGDEQHPQCPACGAFLAQRGRCVNLRCVYDKYRVEAASVEDFLDHYYKPERFRGRGEEYAAALIASHTADFERDGYDVISHHDSVTRETVAFFGPAEGAGTAGQVQTWDNDDAPQGQDADADTVPPSQYAAPLSTPDDLIHSYTRAQAIEDGALVDVSETAREAGFRWPVALTAGVWALIEDIPPRFQGFQDIQGRLWDVLWMARSAARRNDGREMLYELILHHGRKTYATFKLVSSPFGQSLRTKPGDQGEPVITIMLPDED